ncbi:MAG: methyltransferase domain-containing protein [Pyrinomonadaceae bacterium]|nr:methyltransferase domain-containing protein [Pyrinomonadaceae bacterium]
MRLAYFSPLNPQASGISDYSEELLPYLAAHAEIDLFVEGFRPSNPKIRTQFKYFDYHRDPSALDRLQDYDAVVYHMGNDHRYHAGMFEVAREHPGIVVFHDFALQDFFLGLARAIGRVEVYLEEVAACHGYDATREAAEALERGSTPGLLTRPTDFPLNCRLARSAEGIIVHSEWGRARFVEVAPSVPVAHINMPIKPLPASRATNEGQEADGTAAGVVQIANFGLITPGKGIEKALRALSSLKADHSFHYTLVGEPNAFFDVLALVRDYDMEDRVTITGHLRLDEFEQRIATTNIALNLRERTVGETSASLCRIMAAGVPAIVFNVGAFSEIPGDAVVKVDHDRHADAVLLAYLRRLIEDRNLRERIGRNARRYILENHDIKMGAANYLTFIRQVIASRPRRQLLNNVADELSLLGIRAKDDGLLRAVATEVTVLMPTEFALRKARLSDEANSPPNIVQTTTSASDNGHSTTPTPASDCQGRTPKVDGIDYKQAAIDYLGELSEERHHHLRTKPFYNLANKPAKYKGEGMDADMHRHFCDFANIAVGLALPPGARILDVGCGSGWLSEYFARLGYDVKGIDVSPPLIAMSRERVARVPYGVDHETPLRCTFDVHDIELTPLKDQFDAVICYDSLHHLADEQAVFRHLAAMLDVGGLLFILEGHKPREGSETEAELRDVMREFGTLESPFSSDYLRMLLDEHGFAVIGDYVSVNGLFERELLEGDLLPLRTLATDYHYLLCMKVTERGPASSVRDSRQPGMLRAEFRPRDSLPQHIEAGDKLELAITIKNAGDTLWLSGQTVRAGVVMPGVRIIDDRGQIIAELHGHPMLPHAVPPGQSVAVDIPFAAPATPGMYTVKIDLVDQHICWFEERGSQPLLFRFEVKGNDA